MTTDPKKELDELDLVDHGDPNFSYGQYWIAKAILVLAIQVARIATRFDQSVGPGGVMMFREQK